MGVECRTWLRCTLGLLCIVDPMSLSVSSFFDNASDFPSGLGIMHNTDYRKLSRVICVHNAVNRATARFSCSKWQLSAILDF